MARNDRLPQRGGDFCMNTTKIKKWDWAKCKEINSPEHVFLLKQAFEENWDEDTFVREFCGLPGGGHKPSKGRREYRYIKNNFGVFT